MVVLVELTRNLREPAAHDAHQLCVSRFCLSLSLSLSLSLLLPLLVGDDSEEGALTPKLYSQQQQMASKLGISERKHLVKTVFHASLLGLPQSIGQR